jgi:Holliday junction resolvase-like predicted endonuclease
MPRIFTSKRQKIGEFGEMIASYYLKRKGLHVIERNYTKPWGEIDIIAQSGPVIHFIEVKTVSRERNNKNIDGNFQNYRPEDNMHPYKIHKLYRTIATYLTDRRVPERIDWQLDLICVYLNNENRRAKIMWLRNII